MVWGVEEGEGEGEDGEGGEGEKGGCLMGPDFERGVLGVGTDDTDEVHVY
jgi:hypothetical protein